MKLRVYNRNEGAGPWWMTGQWYAAGYVGEDYRTRFKGWWKLGPGSINRYFEVEFAIGGEDNMIQFGFVLPFLLRWHIGMQVPRTWTRKWVYQRREWTIRIGYIGRWLEVLFAVDDSMQDMASYYRRQRAQGDEMWTTRAQEWPGWHLTIRPRPIDWLFGRMVCETTKGPPEPIVIPMPEGNYDGQAVHEQRIWRRKRWPWPVHKRSSYWIEVAGGIPVPGKGENSYDCEDDAIYGTGGTTKPHAIANVVRGALRDRERYAGPKWVPDKGWPVDRKAAA